jgi:hypothetical protein
VRWPKRATLLKKAVSYGMKTGRSASPGDQSASQQIDAIINLCMADILKNAVRLTFPKGARMQDPQQLFNARLDSTGVRAIDYHEGVAIDEAALQALIREAVELNR